MEKDEKDECGVFAKSPLNFRLTGCPAATVPHIGHIVFTCFTFYDPARFWYASRAVLVLGLSFSLASYHCQLVLVVECVSIVAKLGSGVFAAQLDTDSLNKVSQDRILTRRCTELICQLRSSRVQASQAFLCPIATRCCFY